MRPPLFVLAFFLCAIAHGGPVMYDLRYELDTPAIVHVHIHWPQSIRTPANLVMPRNYPGGYAQLPYDTFVQNLVARSADGQVLEVLRDEEGPRWRIGRTGSTLADCDYEIDIGAMERTLHDAVASSRIRTGYAGLLGYSVFAYLEDAADGPVELTVTGPTGWPMLSTLEPMLPAPAGTLRAIADDYYALADSQILMGPDLKLTRLDAAIPLTVAIYAEAPVDGTLEASLAQQALDRVQRYFGDTPISHYTVQLELLRPIAGHAYGFSQEHVDSGSFSLSADTALTSTSPSSLQDRARFNFAHHMAHSWIPKRAYGRGYRPFNWEMTPVIDTIWFNEGFGLSWRRTWMSASVRAARARGRCAMRCGLCCAGVRSTAVHSTPTNCPKSLPAPRGSRSPTSCCTGSNPWRNHDPAETRPDDLLAAHRAGGLRCKRAPRAAPQDHDPLDHARG